MVQIQDVPKIRLGDLLINQSWIVENVKTVEIVSKYRVRGIVSNATFNNISVISWQSVFWVVEIGMPGENHPPVANH